MGSILPLGVLPLGEKAKRYCSLEVSPEVKPTTRHCNSEGKTLYEMIVCCVQALTEVWRVFASWALTQATDVWSAAPGGKVVGTKLRKDDFSVFSAFYFNSPAMWQEGTGPATTEDLTNAVSTLDGQLPHPPRLLCLPLAQWWLWPAMSFLARSAGPVPPSEVSRTWGLSTPQCSASDLMYAGLTWKGVRSYLPDLVTGPGASCPPGAASSG